MTEESVTNEGGGRGDEEAQNGGKHVQATKTEAADLGVLAASGLFDDGTVRHRLFAASPEAQGGI